MPTVTKTLLLNNNYQVLGFINERRAIKLYLKDKVEVLSNWGGKKISTGKMCIDHPATLRMKYQVAVNATKLSFSRNLIFRRDKYICAYCGIKQFGKNLTIDHILPKSMGGQNSFSNCVTACVTCNRGKSNRTPEQAGMSLKTNPITPNRYLPFFPSEIEYHQDWLFFVRH